MLQRKSWYVKPGNFKNLQIREEFLPLPAEHEVQIEIHSFGLNFADIFCVLGLYNAAPKEDFIPGLEFAGVISKTGSKVTEFRPGDRVMGVSRFGAYTSHLNSDENYILPLPTDWSMQEGAGYLVQVLTAYYGLKELGNVKEGQNVLIHSSAGGVGIWANRICKHLGCFTIGTIGSPSKLALLESENCDRKIVRNPSTFKKQLLEALEGRDLHLIMDSIGGKIFVDGYKTLAPMGRVVVFGTGHYTERTDKPNYPKLIWKYLTRPMLDPQNMTLENKSVMAFNLIYLFNNSDIMHQMLKELREMKLDKTLISTSYSFPELPDALREFQSGRTIGKLVVNLV